MFQVGLATLFFFSPQNMATAAGVAAAFAVLLLPFTVVGPFAGPLLDRWSRRQVLVVGNAVRVVLALITAGLLATGSAMPPIYVLALLTLGINRFLLSALSAGLPRVVPREQLLMANTLTPSLGAVAAVVGAGIGFILGRLTPAGPIRDAVALVVAGVIFALASALALRLRRDELGPDEVSTRLRDDLRAVVGDLVAGARYVIARRTPGNALAVMAAHRFLYGVNFIALILISRNLLTDPADVDAGLAMFATLTVISFIGNGVGILATPIAHEKMSTHTWIVTCLGLGMVSEAILAASYAQIAVAIGAFLMGFSVQGAKIAVDTVVQRDTHDAFRGRTFALYDMAYNAAFAGAAALAALILPDAGWSPTVFAALALTYLLLAWWYRRRPTTPVALA